MPNFVLFIKGGADSATALLDEATFLFSAPASCHLIVVVQSPPLWEWVKMAGQISRGARPKGRLHCLGLFFRWAVR